MSNLDPIIEPRFRFELISHDALEALDMSAGVLARECMCSSSAMVNYQAAVSVPGGLILGRMAQALRRRGSSVTGWPDLLGIEAQS